MKISVVIPNYNGEKILEKNLPKVLDSLRNLKEESEIVIADDFSSDSSVGIIENFIEKNKNGKVVIKLVKRSRNGGFSSNTDFGVENATGEILVLLNTDVVPSENFIEFLLPHFKNEKVFAVGCMDESVEGEKIVLRGRGKGKWKRGFLNHGAADIDDNKQTLWVSGGSGAFRKSIWDKLGGLDRLYDPFYWEDIDLSYRARKSGYVTLFEKKSIVRHEHEQGVIKTKYKSEKVKRIVYRNQFIFAWKNSDLNTLLSSIAWLPLHLINAVFSRDSALIVGFLFALKRLPGIIKSRRNARKYFVKSDSEVVKLIEE
jgi:GT2 family glycosyltransferase